MGKIVGPPSWILKYKERIEKGELMIEDILEMENKIRKTPIKLLSVKRAINAMGHPIVGLRRGGKAEEEKKVEKETGVSGETSEMKKVEEKEEQTEVERVRESPAWLLKYKEGIDKGELKIEDIQEMENKIRKRPIKATTVARAINAMDYSVAGLQRGKKRRETGIEEEKKEGGEKEAEKEAAVEAEAKEETIETEEERKEEQTVAEKIKNEPAWLLKYKEGIDKGELKIEDILESENKIRDKPLKATTVARAINAMGYSSAGLQRGKKRRGKGKEREREKEETKAKVETVEKKEKEGEEVANIRGAPNWILKYKEKIEKGEITIEAILEMENKVRETPIKLTTVERAINGLGHPIVGLRESRKGREKKKEIKKKEEKVYPGIIDKISKDTEERFVVTKENWEKDLGKSLHNDYFVNILLALAKLAEHGKTLVAVPGKESG